MNQGLLYILALFAVSVAAQHFHVEPAEDLQYLFNPEAVGWLGSDDAASFEIGDGVYMYLYGDSLFGHMNGSRRAIKAFVRNSVGIIDTRKPKLHQEFFAPYDTVQDNWGTMYGPPPGQEAHWLWPTSGVAVGDKVFLFAQNLVKSSGGLGFASVGTTLVECETGGDLTHPLKWSVAYHNLTFTSGTLDASSSCSVFDDYVLVTGRSGDPSVSDQVMFSIKKDDLYHTRLDKFFVYCQQEEGQAAANAGAFSAEFVPIAACLQKAVLFEPGFPEYTITHQEYLDRWFGLLDNSFVYGNTIMARIAPQPYGPFSAPLPVYDVPAPFNDSSVFFHYAAKVHPELSIGKQKEVVFTYATNAWKGFEFYEEDSSVYLPRAVRVTFTSRSSQSWS